MPIHLNDRDLANTQQMEVSITGPDGATHLILCTGIATIKPSVDPAFTFLVGPRLLRRQFVAVIAWGAFAKIQFCGKGSDGISRETNPEASLFSITGDYDDETGRVKIRAEVAPCSLWAEIAVSYHVSILAELTRHGG